MNPALFSFYPKFLLSEKTGNDKTPALQVFDETPYVANGIDLDAVAGVILSAKRENVSFYANTDYDAPDVTLDPVLNEKVDLPVDANDDALYGDYEFTYKVRVTNEIIGVDGATTAPGAATFSSLLYEGAVIADFVTKVNQLVTYLGSNFVIQFINASNVVVGQSVVTSAENDGGDLVVNFTEVTDADYASITKMRFLSYYSGTVLVSYCAQDWPTGVLVVTGNCLTAQISVQDQTQYQASDTLSRTMVLNYPILANGTPVETAETTSTASMLIGPNIWTGNYTAALTSVLTREQTDTLVLQYSVIKYTYFLLECDAGLCCMRSCIDNIFNSYKSALQVGSANLSILRDNIITIMGYVNLYGIAVNCGNTQAASDYLTALQNYMDSIGCDCNCSDSPTNGEPTIVYPLFSSPQPNYIPISYLEINDITTNSNSKVPSNKAVLNYLDDNYYDKDYLIANYYTNAQTNDEIALAIDAISYDSANVASGFEAITLNQRSGLLEYSPSSPIPPGSQVLIIVTNNTITTDDMILTQIKTQNSISNAALVIVSCSADSNRIDIVLQNIGVSACDDLVFIQFLANKK